MLFASGGSATVQAAGVTELKKTDVAATATAALCATTTAAHNVEPATERAVAEGSLRSRLPLAPTRGRPPRRC